jgi:quercetin dioxygenase-like cupin family protein
MRRLESITRADGPATAVLAPGVEVRDLATGSMGALGLTTSLATFQAGATLPFHRHPFSEVIVVVAGEASVQIEGRRYRMRPFDAMHVPAGTPHSVQNESDHQPAVLHTSFASETPTREDVAGDFPLQDLDETDSNQPETLVRFASAPIYELASRAHFRDLFGGRFGARGVCGGYGVFGPGASLPCHFHEYDESITIVSGQAISQVAGREYLLADCATACIPRGRPHRFINRSDQAMAMIWVYAGDVPERTLVDAGYCEGSLSYHESNG